MTVEQTIHEGWYFANAGSDDFFTAQVPGTIHTKMVSFRIRFTAAMRKSFNGLVILTGCIKPLLFHLTI